MAFDLVACSRDINAPVVYVCSTNYLALAKTRVNTAKQISYRAPKRCLFLPFPWEALAPHYGSPVRRHQHHNLQLGKGSWHVLPVLLNLPAKPVTVDPHIISICGPSSVYRSHVWSLLGFLQLRGSWPFVPFQPLVQPQTYHGAIPGSCSVPACVCVIIAAGCRQKFGATCACSLKSELDTRDEAVCASSLNSRVEKSLPCCSLCRFPLLLHDNYRNLMGWHHHSVN